MEPPSAQGEETGSRHECAGSSEGMRLNKNKSGRPRVPLLAVLLVIGAIPVAQAQAPKRLLELSIEELGEIEVTSASRRAEPLAATAAAIFVITAEDIRRSGATSIPEALRLAPGLQVARIDSRRWAITARGFGGEFSNKLLVLMDGRSVYTPVHSGVNWEFQDTLLQDIERIEVIRGPGAAQWGANAVNGVINIITRSSHDTHGGVVTAAVGSEQDLIAGRWGDSLGENASYRAYGKYFKRDESRGDDGDPGDDWWQGRMGFRADWSASASDDFTLQGDLYQTDENQRRALEGVIVPADRPASYDDARGGNLLGRWTRALGKGEALSLQAYLDWYEADPLLVREKVITFDLDLQHSFRLDERQQIVWGLGFRNIKDEFDSSPGIAFNPDSSTSQLYSAFLQDTIALTKSLALTVGSKFEYTEHTELEVQPSMTLSWMSSGGHTLWGSVARAVRTPSRGERDLEASLGGGLIEFNGNSRLDAERLVAYQLGYRFSPLPQLFLDLVLFHHEYDDVVGSRYSFENGGMTGQYANGVDGSANGLELVARWQAHPRWRLDLAYTYLDMRLSAGDLHPESTTSEYTHPEHQVSLFSRLDLSHGVQLDAWLRYVDDLPGRLPSQAIPGYTELDLRLAWQPQPKLTLSLMGQNLLDSSHPEFSQTAEIERAVYLRADWRF